MRSLVALVLLAALVAACGGRSGAPPAWPKAAEREVDGGESLEPRQSTAVASADADDEAAEDAEVVVVEVKAAATTTPTAATPSTTPTTITAPEEVINLDDIVIEIDD